MSIVLPDHLFPAIVFFKNTLSTSPLIITVLVYSSNQPTPIYTAWFNETSYSEITVYKDGDKWIEKKFGLETVNSKNIGMAIENYSPFKS